MAEVVGAIRTKWLELGGAGFAPALGVERPAFDGVGRTQAFRGGKMISWHPAVGAFGLWGAIGAQWIALGSERSTLGYPRSDEFAAPEVGPGGRRTDFQHGFMTWTPMRGVWVHGPVCVDSRSAHPELPRPRRGAGHQRRLTIGNRA